MLGFGLGEMLIVTAVALLVVGPERLPRVLRQLGRWYGQARRAADDLRRAFVLEADRQDAAERYARLKERRNRTQQERAEPAAGADEPAPELIPGEEAEDEVTHAHGGVAQQPPVFEPDPPPDTEDLADAETVAYDANADPPDAPHPSRPTPLPGERP